MKSEPLGGYLEEGQLFNVVERPPELHQIMMIIAMIIIIIIIMITLLLINIIDDNNNANPNEGV